MFYNYHTMSTPKKLSIDFFNSTYGRVYGVVALIDNEESSVVRYCDPQIEDLIILHAQNRANVSYCYPLVKSMPKPAGTIVIAELNEGLLIGRGISYQQQVIQGLSIPVAQVHWRQEFDGYSSISYFTNSNSQSLSKVILTNMQNSTTLSMAKFNIDARNVPKR